MKKKASVKIERAWFEILQAVDAVERNAVMFNITEYLYTGHISDPNTYQSQDIILNMIKRGDKKRKDISDKRRKAGLKSARTRWGNSAVEKPKKEEAPKPQQPQPQQAAEKPSDMVEDKQIQTLLDSSMWIETLAMKFKITTEQVKEYIKHFAIDSNCRGATHNSERELKNHITNWISYQQQLNNNGYNKQDKRRGTEPTATSWEDYEGHF